jgi:glycosyltransferase involved in cell wall biosynthesis
MKLALLVPDLTGAHGWSQYSLSLIHALHRANIYPTLLTAQNSPPQAFETHPLLPNVVPLGNRIVPSMLRQIPRLRQLLRGHDVVHSTVEHYGTVQVLNSGNQRYVLTIHGTYAHLPVMSRFPLNALYRHTFRHSDLVCVSHYTAKIVKNVVPTAHTHVIPNGVDTARFAHLPALPKNGRIVLATGGIKRRKGTLELVQAIAVVRQTLPDVHCVIVGRVYEQAYHQRVLQAIDQHNLHEHITLTGFVSDNELLRWYAQADVFVLPSVNSGYHFEGFGLVHLEASAAGLPVIGTSDCGAEDAIKHGVTGLLVSQSDLATRLPHAILDILLNPKKAQEMGNAGKLKAHAQTWDTVAQALLKVYAL